MISIPEDTATSEAPVESGKPKANKTAKRAPQGAKGAKTKGKSAKKATPAKTAPKAKKTAKVREGSKTDQVLELLKRPRGVTAKELMEVTESIEFAAPVISVVVEPKTKADQEKMGMALGRLAQEDPTFKVHTDPDSGQTIISGMGELHLEIIVDRMMREYKVEANVGKPQVAYRETIRKHAEAEGKYIRQTGGRGQYGHAKIKLDPQPPGTGYEFVNEIIGGSVPKEFIKPIDQGMQEAMEGGVLAGYPMVDVKATLYDGSYHDVDSNEMAFKIAGSMAFKEAARKASPVLLEPVMAVEVVTPEDYAGVIMGDLSSRRGRIEGMEHRAGSQVIKAIVPLAEMFGYATHMRSSTQGRAEYSMHFARYEEAPRSVAEEIIAKVQGTAK